MAGGGLAAITLQRRRAALEEDGLPCKNLREHKSSMGWAPPRRLREHRHSVRPSFCVRTLVSPHGSVMQRPPPLELGCIRSKALVWSPFSKSPYNRRAGCIILKVEANDLQPFASHSTPLPPPPD